MSRSEVRGSVRAARDGLMRARQALLDAVEDDEVMFTPADMDEMYHIVKDSQVLLTDIKKVSAKFGTVAEARRDIMPSFV